MCNIFFTVGTKVASPGWVEIHFKHSNDNAVFVV